MFQLLFLFKTPKYFVLANQLAMQSSKFLEMHHTTRHL